MQLAALAHFYETYSRPLFAREIFSGNEVISADGLKILKTEREIDVVGRKKFKAGVRLCQRQGDMAKPIPDLAVRSLRVKARPALRIGIDARAVEGALSGHERGVGM